MLGDVSFSIMKNSLSKIIRPTTFTTKYFANIKFVKF
jgi:hypothetical protein